MNRLINEKLTALRKQLTVGEATGPQGTYVEYMMDADVEFLSAAAKILKQKMGTKVAPKVQKGTSTVFMELEGVNRSDMEVSLTVALHTVSWTDVKLKIWGDAGMRGRVDEERGFKTGVLTPKLVADSIMEFLQ